MAREKAPGILITPLHASLRAFVFAALPADHPLYQVYHRNIEPQNRYGWKRPVGPPYSGPAMGFYFQVALQQ